MALTRPLTATLHRALFRALVLGGGAPGGGPGGSLPVVDIQAWRDDGGTGSVRVTGLIPFGVGVVQPADLASATLWDESDVEVPMYLGDLLAGVSGTTGARHRGSASPTSVHSVEIEFTATFAALTTVRNFKLRFDRTSTLTRESRTGPTIFTNTPQIGTDATGKKFRLLNSVTYFYGDDDTPRIAAPQDIEFGLNAVGAFPSISAGGYQAYMLAADINGTVVAYPFSGGSGGAQDAKFIDTSLWYPWYLSTSTPTTRAQPISTVFIGCTSGTITPGPGGASIDGTNASVWVTLTANAKKPFSNTLQNVAAASCAPSDPAYLTRTSFPGYTHFTESEINALSSPYVDVLADEQNASNVYWYLAGPFGALDSGGSTAYNYPEMEDILYCITGKIRYARRSKGYGRYMYDYLNSVNFSTSEPACDAGALLVYGALWNQLDAVALGAAKLVSNIEERQLNHLGNTNIASGSGRDGMNAVAGLHWAETFGLQLDNTASIPGSSSATTGAYVLVGAENDDAGWPNALTNWGTVSGNSQRLLRMIDRYVNYMKSDPFSRAANVGKRFLNLQDYDVVTAGADCGVGCFMQGRVLSEMIRAIRRLGVVPTGFLNMVRDATDWILTAVSPITLEPYLTDNGTNLVYGTPGGWLSGNGNDTIATAMTAYNDTTLVITDSVSDKITTPTTGPLRIKIGTGTLDTAGFYSYSGKTGNTLTGLTYLFGAQSAWGVGSSVKNVSGGGGTGENLLGFHAIVFWWLLQQTLDPKWRTQYEKFYKNMGVSDIRFNHKELSEMGLLSNSWFGERNRVPIPGVTGVLDAITLNQTNPPTLLQLGSTPQLLALSVTSYTDALTDPVSPVGATTAWSSSNPAVATVDSSGNVSSVGGGTTTITASVTLNGVTKSATCTVTVAVYQLHEDFDVDGAVNATTWLSTQSGTTTHNVSGGTLVHTCTNASNCSDTMQNAFDATTRTVRIKLASFTTGNMTTDSLVTDSAGVGVSCRLSLGTFSVGTVTNAGPGTTPSFTIVGSGISLSAFAATGVEFEFTFNASNQVTVRYATAWDAQGNATSWTTKATNVAPAGFDRTTVKARIRSAITAGGVGPLTTKADRVYVF